MTLIVYSKNKLYGDDLGLFDRKTLGLHMRRGVEKVRVTSNEFAVAVCGPFPKQKHRLEVAIGLRKLAFYSDQGMRDSFNHAFTQEKFERFQKISNADGHTTYLIGTTRNLYKLEKDGLSILNKDFEYAFGSGVTYYGICRKKGFTVEQSYELVAQYEKTVGKLTTIVDLSTLDDMVDGIIQDMLKSPDPVTVSAAEKARVISNRYKKEMAQ